VVGIDISSEMLEIGKAKVRKLGLSESITLQKGDSENLGFSDNTFDAVTVAFGVRNFGNLDKGLYEMHRVLRLGGMIAVLEFSRPKAFPFKQVYDIYFSYILPFWGRLISKNSTAYSYLPESVKHFPEGEAFAAHLLKAGFTRIGIKPLTLGICTLYTAVK
jgi:demethylmenaquinone methyltransferase/2-methoxy-6-polyprenyl-1,4-benzoquinol methylase